MSDVAVLIVNYLTGDLVADAVQALSPAGFDIRVWDNSGDVPATLREHATVEADGRNQMFAAPNNRMYAASSAPFVLLLNPDVLIAPESVHGLIEALSSDPDAWGVMPRLVGPDGEDQNYLRRLPTLRMLLADRLPLLRSVFRGAHDDYYGADVDLKRDTTVEQPPAACLLLRRDVVGERLFDDSYRLFFNDTDLARRLNHAGGHCRYVAGVTARHIGGASIARARPTRRAWIRREYDISLLRYARRNLRGWQLLAPVIALRVVTTSLVEVADRFHRRMRG
jgi:N-acetylglucosaminyl-diphospho-decaprenol L-rhamnosyltransferase